MNIFKRAYQKVMGSSTGTVVFEDGLTLDDFLSEWNNLASVKVNSESAMRSSSIYSAVSLISGAIASCPIKIYVEKKEGKTEDKKHYLKRILGVEPWERMTGASMIETATWRMLLKGNAYILINRNLNGLVKSLQLLEENSVGVEKMSGRLRYGVVGDDNVYKVYDQDDILHLPSPFWRGNMNGGVSFLHWAGISVGLNLAALDSAATFYQKGARIGGVLEADKNVTPEARKLLKQHFQEMRTKRVDEQTPLILEGGLKFKDTVMSAKDQMIVEQLRWNVTDIARLFKVPALLLGEQDKSSSQPGSMETVSRHFVTYCLTPHLQRFEQEFTRKLFRGKNHKYSCHFSVEGLLRGDHKTRAEYYAKARGSLTEPGWMSVNEIRERENLPKEKDYDKIIKPSEKKKEKESQDAE